VSSAPPADPRIEPERLPGVDPSWSRVVVAPDGYGIPRRWHLLDNDAVPTVGTMLCVHGNPTWSYLWRRLLAAAAPGWRVVAVDQLGMGWSERLPHPRTMGERIADLGALTAALSITGRVVTVGHDWGGPISLGWALAHRAQLAGVVLFNTGVDLPPGAAPPGLIRLVRTPALRRLVCVGTPTFVRGASALSRPCLPAAVRRALELPYADAASRQAVGDFVADIPVEIGHPSRPALDALTNNLGQLATVPAMLLWGPRDPVFSERFLEDLLDRLPHADVQRYPRASHLVTEDAPQSAADVWRWVGDLAIPEAATRPPAPECRPPFPELVEGPEPVRAPTRLPWDALLARSDDPAAAVVELQNGRVRRTSFEELERRVRDLAAGLSVTGVRAGDRVALLVPPGLDLTVAVYACWRVGAVIVIADAGLGLRGMAHALRSAGPDHIIGISKALLAVSALRVPGRRIVVERVPDWVRKALGWGLGLAGLVEIGRDRELPTLPAGDPEAAVLFTSGATGPAKGVVYRMSQLRAQVDQVRRVMGVTTDDRLVAAFAPFALYGPALGVGAAVPDMSVTLPGTLTARALADAVMAVDATVVFASPAALRNVVATAGGLGAEQRAALAGVRRLMSAGAPVPVSLLRAVQRLLPGAELHTPYGMTEALPVTDISLAQIEAAGSGNGVCVGWPLPGVSVRVSSMDDLARADGDLTDVPGVTGEICIAAAHVKHRYDRLWAVERDSSRNPGWHRSGDVGHFDAEGRLWVEGRLVHVVITADGPVTPVGVEQRIEALPEVEAAAVVGVGPAGTQQAVAVVVTRDRSPRSGLASLELSTAVRSAAKSALPEAPEFPLPEFVEGQGSVGVEIAAVITVDHLPVDIRHASKVDRARIARWAERMLAGERVGRL